MATAQQLEEGIRRAHKAGDANAVRVLGQQLVAMRKGTQRTAGQRLWTSAKNIAAGAVEGPGSLADFAATGAGKVMSLVPSASAVVNEVIGNKGAADFSRSVASRLANPSQIRDVTESVVPQPKDWNTWLQRQVMGFGTGTAALPAKAMTRAAELVAGRVPKTMSPAVRAYAPPPKTVVDAGKQAGVRVLTSDVRPPRTFIGRSTQAVGERIPFAGTGGVRQAQQAERVEAVRNLASEYGALAETPAIDSVMADLAAKRGAELTRQTNAKTAVIGKLQGVVPVDKTIAAIDQQIGKLQKVGTDASNAIIGKLQNWRQAVAGKDLSTIELIRKEMGEAFKDQGLAGIRKAGEKALNAIYGPLRDDMGTFIKAVGDKTDFTKWKTANDRLAAMAGELGNATLKKVLTTGEMTPENVAKLLFSQKPSDVRRLYGGLSAVGRSRAQSAIIQKALEKSSGVEGLSPDRFAGQISALGKSIGVFFQGDDLARIEGLHRVLSATRRAGQASLHPPTGVQNTVPILAAVLADALGSAGAAIATGAGAGLLAKAYESAPVRNALLLLSKTKPGSRQEATMMKRVATAIATTTAQNRSSSLPAAMNENIPLVARSAASPGADAEEQQQ